MSNVIHKYLKRIHIQLCKTATYNARGNEPSENAFNDCYNEDLSISLVDLPSTGQTAPVTGLTASTTLLSKLFHTVFLHASTWPSF
ncbi:hypothetical protein Hanom_Chr09g00825541 [Helianthus anomalus]